MAAKENEQGLTYAEIITVAGAAAGLTAAAGAALPEVVGACCLHAIPLLLEKARKSNGEIDIELLVTSIAQMNDEIQQHHEKLKIHQENISNISAVITEWTELFRLLGHDVEMLKKLSTPKVTKIEDFKKPNEEAHDAIQHMWNTASKYERFQKIQEGLKAGAGIIGRIPPQSEIYKKIKVPLRYPIELKELCLLLQNYDPIYKYDTLEGDSGPERLLSLLQVLESRISLHLFMKALGEIRIELYEAVMGHRP